ncbi:hypothetical protein JXM83_01400 [Candidatus Woesearchaeota archaeon]|nr:hypothetical protein [Candidatus Woesearchaeota archaeon]
MKAEKTHCKTNFANTCKGGAIYAFGLMGAAFYYISTATSFWGGVIGFVKAIFWPVFLIYQLMKYLGM